MKISIITPVLNGARFLPDLITSLERQTYPDWEHIIVDGGSTDGSLDIAAAWAASNARVRLVEAPGLGLYPSIFHGFDLSTGDLLAWLASDDLYTSWAFATVVDHARRTGAQWLTGLPGAWDRSGSLRYVRPYGAYPQAWIRKGWFHGHFLGHLQQESMFFSRELICELAPPHRNEIQALRLAGDFLLWRRLAERAPLTVVPTALAGFRFHGHNLSVSGADGYMQEVRATGAPFPHPRIARLAARTFRAWSALKALTSVQVADANLHASLSEPPNQSI